MSKFVMRQSIISTFLKCGLAYKFEYIDKVERAPTAKMALGTIFDSVNNLYLQNKIDGGPQMSFADLENQIDKTFDQVLPETDWQSESPELYKHEAKKIVHVYLRDIGPNIDPLAVQKKITVETDLPYNFEGTLDVVTKNEVIRDLKVSANPSFYDTNGLQATMYSYLYEIEYGKAPKQFVFDVIKRETAKNPPQYLQKSGLPNSSDRNHMFYAASAVHQQIQAGIFLPASEMGFWCKKGQCPYWDICKGKKP